MEEEEKEEVEVEAERGVSTPPHGEVRTIE